MILGPIAHIIILARPAVVGAFANSHFAYWLSALDGAMWTIQYEFFCYLLVLGLVYVPQRLRALFTGAMAAILLALAAWEPIADLPSLSRPLLFPVGGAMLLTLPGLFFSGATYWLMRHRLHLTMPRASIALVLFVAMLVQPTWATIGYAIFGTYLILFIAARAGSTVIGAINRNTDISYGVYLYAWPIEQLLVRAGLGSNLLALGVATWVGAVIAGWLSWTFVEEPVKGLVERRLLRSQDGSRESSGKRQ